MNRVDTDIDIDFSDRENALAGLPAILASQYSEDEGFSPHPSGVYLQNIPINPLTGCAALPYDVAPDFGYFKIDFLNNHVYDGIRDEEHLVALMEQEPDWKMLEYPEIVQMLNHVYGHFGTLQTIRPTSIEDLAVVLALIRPGRRHLIGKPRDYIMEHIWKKTLDEEYVFRKSHAIAYAVSVIVQMNLIYEDMASQIENKNEFLDETERLMG